MSFVHGSQGRVYLNGFDLSSFFKNATSNEEIGAHDTTGLGGPTARTFMPGLVDATLSVEGLFSAAVAAVNTVDAVLSAATRDKGADVWAWLPSGDVDGAAGYSLLANVTTYEIESPVDDLVSVTAEAQSNVGLEPVLILHPLTARTTTANGVARDNTLATTQGGVGYLQVTAASGATPNLLVRIQHSVDGSAWVDLVPFTAVTVANRAQRLAVAGTVNRHVRAQWTITGTTPSFTFHAAFGRY